MIHPLLGLSGILTGIIFHISKIREHLRIRIYRAGSKKAKEMHDKAFPQWKKDLIDKEIKK